MSTTANTVRTKRTYDGIMKAFVQSRNGDHNCDSTVPVDVPAVAIDYDDFEHCAILQRFSESCYHNCVPRVMSDDDNSEHRDDEMFTLDLNDSHPDYDDSEHLDDDIFTLDLNDSHPSVYEYYEPEIPIRRASTRMSNRTNAWYQQKTVRFKARLQNPIR